MRILGESLDQLQRSRSSVKWRVYPDDVLPVWVAEMDARPCQPVVEAAVAALERGDTGYSFGAPFAEAFSRYSARTWGWGPDPTKARLMPDMMIGIEELIHVITPPGGDVVISPPVYDSFFGFVESTRRRVIPAPLTAEGRLDPTTLEGAFRHARDNAVYLLCSPQNPTGAVHTADELATLARLADEHGVVVISDEIHAPLVHPGVEFVPYLSVPGTERGISLVSASKAWNIAGLKAALGFAGDDAYPLLSRLHDVVRHGANHVAVIAQTAAYNEGEGWLAQVNRELAENRTFFTELLTRHLPGVRVHPAEATYLAWLDCRELNLGPDPAARFLSQGRVALASGLLYDPSAEGFARFNYATSPEVIEEAVRRMAQAVG